METINQSVLKNSNNKNNIITPQKLNTCVLATKLIALEADASYKGVNGNTLLKPRF